MIGSTVELREITVKHWPVCNDAIDDALTYCSEECERAELDTCGECGRPAIELCLTCAVFLCDRHFDLGGGFCSNCAEDEDDD